MAVEDVYIVVLASKFLLVVFVQCLDSHLHLVVFGVRQFEQ